MDLYSYWWSSIKGNLPEDLTVTLALAVLTSIIVPRVRRWWIAREESVHAKLDHVLKQNAHIIKHHPDIGNHSADGTDLSIVPDHLKGRP